MGNAPHTLFAGNGRVCDRRAIFILPSNYQGRLASGGMSGYIAGYIRRIECLPLKLAQFRIIEAA